MNDPEVLSPVIRLAARVGVATEYTDVWGKVHEAEEAGLVPVLLAMGLDAATPQGALAELERLAGLDARSVVDCVVLLAAAGGQAIPLTRVPEQRPLLRVDSLPVRTESFDPDSMELKLSDPLPVGVYPACLEADFFQETMEDRFTIIVSPPKGYLPEPILKGERLWGINLPLYAVRSANSWGVGDLGDLLGAVGFAAEMGADALGLLPLHSLPNEYPYGISPYYPWSRLWINAIYIAVEGVEEAHSPTVRAFLDRSDTRERIAALQGLNLVDYAGVWNLKLEVFRLMWEEFDPASPRGLVFEEWKAEKGEALKGFAVFCALRGVLVASSGSASHWRDWPQEYRRFDSPAVKTFAREHAREVDFHAWLQWLADTQFLAARRKAEVAGLSVGLYLDLALGVDPGGSDAWLYQEILALDASAGCPPDPFSLLGQEWGLPPVKPEALKESGYRFARETFEGNFSHAGAIRIDHAASLARLFWVPKGKTPRDGAYVDYPLEENLALLRALGARFKCVVVGEDLGTVPQEVKDGLSESGFLSYRLLMFEKEWDKTFKAPFNFTREALVSFGTHDLPTMDGWWTGRDLEVKCRLGRYPDREAQTDEARERGLDRKRLVDALIWQKLLPEGFALPTDAPPDGETLAELSAAVHAYVARTPCQLMLANVDDLLGGVEMQNLPGTLQEHPNWRRKLSLPLETWSGSARLAASISAIRAERGGSPRK